MLQKHIARTGDNPIATVAGCRPAATIAFNGLDLTVTPSPSLDFALRVIKAASGSDLYFFLRGSCKDFSSFEFMRFDHISLGT
jgi:hypothetical protein